MIESLELGVRLALDPSPRRTGVVDRVRGILDRPLIAQHTTTLSLVPESILPLVFLKDKIPLHFQEKLSASRIVAFASGLDRLGEPRTAFLYYDADDMLKLTEIQKGIPFSIDLTREGIEDNEVIDLCLARGFVPFYPAGAYPQREEL